MSLDDDCGRGFLTKDELVKKYPGTQEELIRLAAEVAHVRPTPEKTDRKRKPTTFTKRTNSAGSRGQRSRGR
jgi:hypothetical protein